jgi:ribosomal protein S18 acetylase RimI-like enzyme
MKVEELNIADKEQWQLLYCEYADFYQMSMNEGILESVWSWIFDKNNKFYAIGVKSTDDILIGFMHYRDMPSPLRGTIVGFLDDLYVHPDYRGSGAVQALFRELRKISKQKGWPYVRWITATDNHRARNVYDKIANTIDFVTYQMPIG